MKHNVFVYGSLMTGYWNNCFLSESVKLGDGQTGPAFTLLDLGSFPGAVPGSGIVRGEVYEVDDKTLARLDCLEGHPHHYCRELTDIKGFGQCWIYVYNNRWGDMPVIESGCWRSEKSLPAI